MKDEYEAMLTFFDKYLKERRQRSMHSRGKLHPPAEAWSRLILAKANRDARAALDTFIQALAEKAKRRDRYADTLRAELGDPDAEVAEAEEAHAQSHVPARRIFIPGTPPGRIEPDPEKTRPGNTVWTTRRGGGDRV